MAFTNLAASRYAGDAQAISAIKAHPKLGKRIAEFQPTRFRNSIRTQLLHTAVRVDERLLPKLAGCLARLRESAGVRDPIEMYVFEQSAINAFVTRGRSHLFVALSSGAINVLSDEEIEYVVGHELGHALFEHVDFGIAHLLEAGDVEPRDRMQLFAWKRASEISADRVGLILCGSLDVAATALFKSLSGLSISGAKLDVGAFAEQWDHLVSEVVECGDNADHWQLTHPFPPLRMKAMQLFWQSEFFANGSDAAGRPSAQATDGEIGKLLAMMDPLAREGSTGADPLLADFLLWGGLYIALANGDLHAGERQRLSGVVSPGALQSATAGGLSIDGCLAMFGQFLDRRHQRLKSLEIHRIIDGLLHIAHADGEMDARERNALETLTGRLGVAPAACELMISRFNTER